MTHSKSRDTLLHPLKTHLQFFLCYLIQKNRLDKSVLFAGEALNGIKSTIKNTTVATSDNSYVNHCREHWSSDNTLF